MRDTCNIVVLGLPGAWFNSPAAIEDFRYDAETYEAACVEYQQTRDEDALWEALLALAIDPVDIEWQLRNPSKRLPRAYFAA